MYYVIIVYFGICTQSEEISDSNNDIKYKLHWTRPVLYIDNGTFSCHALNSIGESVANVHITVYGKLVLLDYHHKLL